MPSLNWIGKEAVVNHDKEVPFRLLKKVKSASVGENSQNLIIHGDNLEALKALMPYYIGKIKCIYIDPPYNTGKQSWVYNDKVNSPKIKKWFNKVVGNEAADLCRHDKWLCMMYPRLKLLKDLLEDEGMIFISIDDNEVQSLRCIMDEIFGRQNFVAQFIWNTEGHTDNQFDVKVNHEYIVMYAVNQNLLKLGFVVDPNTREESNLWAGFAENSITKNGPANPPSEITLPKGFPVKADKLFLESSKVPTKFFELMKSKGLTSNQLKGEFGKIQFPIRLNTMEAVEGVLTRPCRVFSGWANANKLRSFIENECKPIEDEDGMKLSFYLSEKGVIYYRKDRGDKARNILSVLRNFSTTEKMRSELQGIAINFKYPKPKELIKYIIKIGSNKDSIVLDSFAGSGTTAHAVLDLNKEDGGNRKFILVEMEDIIAKEITAERVKKSIKKFSYKDGFEFCELDKPLFNEEGQIEETCEFNQFATYIYFTETQTNIDKSKIEKSLIGEYNDTEYYLIYKEKDKNILTKSFLSKLRRTDNKKIVYADKNYLDEEVLVKHNIQFKQIPYEVKVY